MTFATMSIGLVPILWSSGTGSEIMKSIAAPMVGGIVTSLLLELLVYPPVYALWRERALQQSPEQLAEEEVIAVEGRGFGQAAPGGLRGLSSQGS
jgi:Cu(I)/Ag(I) efflux system membrane protein CusA/SilA